MFQGKKKTNVRLDKDGRIKVRDERGGGGVMCFLYVYIAADWLSLEHFGKWPVHLI